MFFGTLTSIWACRSSENQRFWSILEYFFGTNKHTIQPWEILLPATTFQLVTKCQALWPPLGPDIMYLLGNLHTSTGLLLTQTPKTIVLGCLCGFTWNLCSWDLLIFLLLTFLRSFFVLSFLSFLFLRPILLRGNSLGCLHIRFGACRCLGGRGRDPRSRCGWATWIFLQQGFQIRSQLSVGLILFDRKLLMEQNPDSDKFDLIQIRFGRSGYLSKLAAHKQNRGLYFNDCLDCNKCPGNTFLCTQKRYPRTLVKLEDWST